MDESSTIIVKMLPISKVEPRKAQPRNYFDEEALEDLAESISLHGLLQPITVRPLDDGYYQIIAGERRWRASRMAGLTEIPVIIRNADELKTQELAMIENLQRQDLTPVEEALGYQALIKEYGLTHEEVAQRIGKHRTYITNSLRLLNLPPSVLEMLENGEITTGHAKALLSLPEKKDQEAGAKEVLEKDLSVRQTERMVQSIAKEPRPVDQPKSNDIDYAAIASEDLTKLLGRKVTIHDGKNSSGRIELEYYNADDRESLIAMLRRSSYLK